MLELYYRFSSIHLDQFAFYEDAFQIDGEKSLSSNLNFQFDEKSNQLTCRFGVQISMNPGDLVLPLQNISPNITQPYVYRK